MLKVLTFICSLLIEAGALMILPNDPETGWLIVKLGAIVGFIAFWLWYRESDSYMSKTEPKSTKKPGRFYVQKMDANGKYFLEEKDRASPRKSGDEQIDTSDQSQNEVASLSIDACFGTKIISPTITGGEKAIDVKNSFDTTISNLDHKKSKRKE